MILVKTDRQHRPKTYRMQFALSLFEEVLRNSYYYCSYCYDYDRHICYYWKTCGMVVYVPWHWSLPRYYRLFVVSGFNLHLRCFLISKTECENEWFKAGSRSPGGGGEVFKSREKGRSECRWIKARHTCFLPTSLLRYRCLSARAGRTQRVQLPNACFQRTRKSDDVSRKAPVKINNGRRRNP